MGALSTLAGRQLASFLKLLLPAWWMLCFDPAAAVGEAARQALRASFPGRKERDALFFCSAEVCLLFDHASKVVAWKTWCRILVPSLNGMGRVLQVTMMIGDNITATAAVLGDPRNESPEAMAERHERVVSSSLLALGGLVRLTLGESGPGDEDGGRGQARVYDCVAGVLHQEGFWSRALKSAKPAIRRSAYELVATIVAVRYGHVHGTAWQQDAASLRVSKMFASWRSGLEILDHSVLAPLVLGSLSDQSSETHSELWAMVLGFCRAYPEAFTVVDFSRTIQPRLLALLRCDVSLPLPG